MGVSTDLYGIFKESGVHMVGKCMGKERILKGKPVDSAPSANLDIEVYSERGGIGNRPGE